VRKRRGQKVPEWFFALHVDVEFLANGTLAGGTESIVLSLVEIISLTGMVKTEVPTVD
jgi:hypothetical protein